MSRKSLCCENKKFEFFSCPILIVLAKNYQRLYNKIYFYTAQKSRNFTVVGYDYFRSQVIVQLLSVLAKINEKQFSVEKRSNLTQPATLIFIKKINSIECVHIR